MLPDIRKVDIKNKTVFVRADLDVPLSKRGKIEDDMRLMAGLPTVKYLLEKGAKVIIGGHLGRPDGKFNEEFSLKPVAEWLEAKIKDQKSKIKIMIGEFQGWEINPKLILLENLRFYKGEEDNDGAFAKQLASLADIYVNDAFAMSHRKHASVVGVAALLPHFAGLHLQKEVENLNMVLKDPKRPLVAIIGGKKIETKLPLVSKMYCLANYVLVGGKICEESENFLKVSHQKSICGNSVLLIADQNQDRTDITEKSVLNFLQVINTAKMIVWNGAMGLIDSGLTTEKGTKMIAQGIAKAKAYKIVGGGDTVEYLKRINLLDKFDFVSTGGGAMLSYLSGENLPGLTALEN